ncbi:hypothetical protein INT47_000784 [Mucor saturninus]|uniref:Uncharacterized protein n=1 Tax=Mucor saturninus TaxID=64648 RepID=A0A8H7RR41_9FUNG|nr:hypothetical protein INT47_000784 [Mucor saturninus]
MYKYDKQHNKARKSRKTRANYQRPDLESWSDEKCYNMFRFTYSEICRICHIVGLNAILRFNSLEVSREFALSLLLYRVSFPRRLSDMVDVFGMAQNNIERTLNALSNILMEKFKYGLEFDERQFSKSNCAKFSRAILEKGGYYPNIVGFIDRTMKTKNHYLLIRSINTVLNFKLSLHLMESPTFYLALTLIPEMTEAC